VLHQAQDASLAMWHIPVHVGHGVACGKGPGTTWGNHDEVCVLWLALASTVARRSDVHHHHRCIKHTLSCT
jgi:hypothetical protein